MSKPKPIRKGLLTLFSLLALCPLGFSQIGTGTEPMIRGTLQLDSIWEPIVYLSYIPTFDRMNTMSNDMIIAEARMDSLGRFSFPTMYLPEEDRIYRLHVSKKNAPAASLIIGGYEENHLFLIANGNTSIEILGTPDPPPFKHATIRGYAPNTGLRNIDHTYGFIDSTQHEGTAMKKEFVTKAIYEELRFAADTSKHALVSLYALYRSNFESHYPNNPVFYENYLDKWQDESSAYFTGFRSQLPITKTQTSWLPYIGIGLGFFGLGFLGSHLYRKRKANNKPSITSLSVQERKIFSLIQSGKSNKEISEEYNIGLSTVKSHVSSIYAKLNIKSRKEAMDL